MHFYLKTIIQEKCSVRFALLFHVNRDQMKRFNQNLLVQSTRIMFEVALANIFTYGMLYLDASAVKRFRSFAAMFIFVVVYSNHRLGTQSFERVNARSKDFLAVNFTFLGIFLNSFTRNFTFFERRKEEKNHIEWQKKFWSGYFSRILFFSHRLLRFHVYWRRSREIEGSKSPLYGHFLFQKTFFPFFKKNLERK